MAPPAVDLAGRLRLWPGAAAGQPAVLSSRPDLLPRLAPGRPARQMPDLLAAVFSLCGHAHRWTAQRALAAALPSAEPDPATASVHGHRVASLREHLLRISQDWPRLLPGLPAAAAALPGLLASCPLWPQARLDALPAWLQTAWLDGLPPATWLQAQDTDPGGWVARWAAQADGPLAALLRSQQAPCQALEAPGPSLCLLDQPAITLPMLARQMSEPGYCAQPHWQGEHPDTGPWHRRSQPQRHPATTAWDRLLARLVETLRLALPGGEQLLSHGAMSLGPGRGLAWTEMARGLLVHQVQLAAGASDAGAPVRAWQVLAPTEWNSHPDGPLARALRRLAPGDRAAATRLAVAFDPCVPFDIAAPGGSGDDDGTVRPVAPAAAGRPPEPGPAAAGAPAFVSEIRHA